MNWTRILMVLVLVLGLGTVIGCSDDDDPTGPGDTSTPWVGTWVSEGADIAPILVTLFNYDRVVVALNANGTVALTTRVTGQAESTIQGTYAVTRSASGNIHSIELIYAAFSQSGIIEVTPGNPDTFRLEAVQTTPDIGATVPTPAIGFGADAGLGTSNIQRYSRVPDHVGSWLSEGSNIAPILVTLFNYDRVVVDLNIDGTVALTTRIAGGAESTINGTYAVTESATGSIHSIEIIYSAFSQSGIIEVDTSASPNTMRLEVVQTTPDISATVPTPAAGFGADAQLGASNIQAYVRQ